MLHEMIRDDDFLRNTALQHCWDIVSNGYNIAPALQKSSLRIVPCNIAFTSRAFASTIRTWQK